MKEQESIEYASTMINMFKSGWLARAMHENKRMGAGLKMKQIWKNENEDCRLAFERRFNNQKLKKKAGSKNEKSTATVRIRATWYGNGICGMQLESEHRKQDYAVAQSTVDGYRHQ